MIFEFCTTTRQQFIKLGHALGRILESHQKDDKWVACLDGPAAAGKSLIVLAIDEIFNPSRYPNGITQDHLADTLTNYSIMQPNVAFFNLWNRSGDDPDIVLSEYASKQHKAEVLLVSNLFRGFLAGAFNHDSVHKARLIDLYINVDQNKDSHARTITISVENKSLKAALAEIQENFAKMIGSTPSRVTENPSLSMI